MASFRNPNRPPPPAPPLSADSIWDTEFHTLAEVLQFATAGHAALPPYWKYLLGTGCPTQIEKDGVQPATRRHSPHSPLLCDDQPALRAKRLWRYYGSVVLIRSHTFSQPSPTVAHILFIRVSPAPRRAVCVQFYWVDSKPAVGLDPVHSPTRLAHLYIIFWHTLHLCNIPLHHVFLILPQHSHTIAPVACIHISRLRAL